MSIGYWAAHEQYPMSKLLEFVIKAEQGGFDSTMASDHFHPWWHDNGYGNSTWIWMAAAAERTKKMRFATGVTSPIYRYHPAIIAQVFASLDVLYPGRIGIGLGAGEAMNEVPLGFDWPKPHVRLERTMESIEIIKALWGMEANGSEGKLVRDKDGFISFNGQYYHIRNAKLYTPPTTRVPIYLASSGKTSAKAAGELADGLITFLKPEKAKEVLSTFDSIGKSKGRSTGSLEKIAEYKVSYSPDYDEAFESTKFWRATLIENVFNSEISDPRQLEEKAKKEVPDEMLKESVQITTSIEDCTASIEKYFDAGFTRVHVHSTSPNEFRFIEDFCKHVLPYFSDKQDYNDKRTGQLRRASSSASA